MILISYIFINFKYEYEKEMEKSYRNSLVKSFKKQIDDGYFSLILVDCINDKTEYYQPMWSYAKQKGFEVSALTFSIFINNSFLHIKSIFGVLWKNVEKQYYKIELLLPISITSSFVFIKIIYKNLGIHRISRLWSCCLCHSKRSW